MPSGLVSINAATQDLSICEQPLHQPSLALICMPWGSVSTPSLAMALLKTCMTEQNIACKLHYFNADFAAAIGLEEYNTLAHYGHIFTEWLFSYSMYGSGGSGELDISWDKIACGGTGQGLVKLLREKNGFSDEKAAERLRHIAEVIVPAFIEQCLREDDWGQYDAVGFTTTFAQSLASLLLARAIKEAHPNVSILFGGANVDGEMGFEMLKGSPFLDYVVHGEAEEILPLLMRQIAAGGNATLPGVSARLQGKPLHSGVLDGRPVVDMDSSPMPDYSAFIASLEKHGFRDKNTLTLFFESSRGCWWGAKQHCTFCGLNGSTMTFRKKSPDRVFDELMHLSNSYQCLRFAATDNILALDYIPTLIARLSEADHDLRLFYETKANLSKAQLKALADAGVRELQPGIESLSTRVLGLMNKGITAIQNVQLLKWCMELDIKPTWNLLFGFPTEQPEDYADLAPLMRLLFHLAPPGGFGPIRFERFSPYHFKSGFYGLELRADPVYEMMYPRERMDLDKLAYFFDNVGPEVAPAAENYTQLAKDVLAEWQAHRKSWGSECTCSYRKGPGFLVIRDQRHALSTKDHRFKQTTLRGEVARTYIFCDQIRSEKAITEFLREAGGDLESERKVFSHLDALVDRGLMIKENGRYLALAIRSTNSGLSEVQ